MLSRLVPILLLTVTACGVRAQATPINPPPRAMTPRPASEVPLFMSTPPYPYREVFLLKSEEDWFSYSSDAELLEALRQRGGNLGCDGVMVIAPTQFRVNRPKGYPSTRTLRGYRAACVMYEDTGCGAIRRPVCPPENGPVAVVE